MPALGGHGGSSQPGRAGTHHGDFFHGNGRQIIEFGFMAGTRVDQATGQFAAKGVVQACLVATDAGIDLVAAPGSRLVDELGVGQERTRHRHHIGIAFGQDLLGDFRSVDAVGGNQRHVNRAAQLGRDLAERGTGHLGSDGRDTRFVPADTGVDQGRTGRFDSLGQLHDFFPDAAAFHQVEHRQAVNDDEVRANGFAHATYDFHRQAHAVFVTATPTVGTLVGVRRQELINQVAFRAHDLDTVIARALGQPGAGHEVADLLFDALLVQLLWLERVDRCLDRTRRDLARAVGIAPGVEDLQADLAAGIVYRASHDHMFFGFFDGAQLGCAAVHPALIVGRNAASDDQADTAAGTLGKVGGHALKATGLFFQAGVHRAHQAAVAQGGKTQVQGGEQMRVAGGGHRKAPQRAKSRNAGCSAAPVVDVRHSKDSTGPTQ